MLKPREPAKIVNKKVELRNEKKLLTPNEASRMLNVSYKALWRWWKEGKIGAVRLPSGRLRYFKDESDV